MSEKSCLKNMPHACGYDIYNSHSEKRQPSLVVAMNRHKIFFQKFLQNCLVFYLT